MVMFKETKTLEDISFAEWGIKVLDVLTKVFESKKDVDTYLDQITGQVRKKAPKKWEFKTIKPAVDSTKKQNKHDTKK